MRAPAALLLLTLLRCGAVALDDGAATLVAPRRSVVAVTRSGPVAGVVDARGARWLDVPYAAPPVGEGRFRAPAPPTPWRAPLDASRAAHRACPQLQSMMAGALTLGEEDCLYLSVFAPAAPSSTLLPVMVFLHGGAYELGDDSEAGLYDGARLAANASVVVVTLNYRLGVLGFLAHPSLFAGNETSNNGLLDQRAALRWVRDNAAAFGGDPERVTLFGQSAGAMAVCAHLASPASAGLFRAAIMQSGNCDSPLLWAPRESAQAQARAFAAAHGCADDTSAAACLRDLPLARLMAHDLMPRDAPLAPLVAWVPVVDGLPDGVPAVPLSGLSSSHAPPVPVILGTVRDEGTLFAAMAPAMLGDAPAPLTAPQLSELLLRVYNASAVAAIVARYADAGTTPTAQLAAVLRDAMFACPGRRAAKALCAAAYVYRFDYVLHWLESRLGLGTYHASELEFVFRNHRAPHIMDDDDRRVEAFFSRLWGAFAHDARPDASAPPAWPPFNDYDARGEGATLLLDASPRAEKQSASERETCDFWDATTVDTGGGAAIV